MLNSNKALKVIARNHAHHILSFKEGNVKPLRSRHKWFFWNDTDGSQDADMGKEKT